MSPVTLGKKIRIIPESNVTISLICVFVYMCVCVCARARASVGMRLCVRAYVHGRACISLICAGALFGEIHDAKLTYGFGTFFDSLF